MAWVKVTDIAYGRLRAPDLDVREEFLTRFGLRRSERTANALYTVILNLVVTIVLTPVFNELGGRQSDATVAADYYA